MALHGARPTLPCPPHLGMPVSIHEAPSETCNRSHTLTGLGLAGVLAQGIRV